MDLFEYANTQNKEKSSPLAERLKPVSLDEFVGQEHIIGPKKLLSRLIRADKLSSIILYGPPGTGKTSLAKVIASTSSSEFSVINAVTGGVKDIREVIASAKDNQNMYGKKTILFIDEIHRFNKSQQDALLPFVEDGTVVLIGATTENPYYEVNNALISRSTVFKLNELGVDNIKKLINRAITDQVKGLGVFNVSIDDEAMDFLCRAAGGDARKALNAIELAVLSSETIDGKIDLNLEILEECVQLKNFKFDKSGDNHYDIASAFIKSIRGSDPDAAIHYMARMIAGGENPRFIARRIVISASEDIGNADPMGLVIANNAAQAVDFIGWPEARIILAQAVIYLASAPKSNASYIAINEALDDVNKGDYGQIPFYLRDATSSSIARKNEDIEEEYYKYPHSYENNYVEQQYLPKELKDKKYYRPSHNGHEAKVLEYFKKIKS